MAWKLIRNFIVFVDFERSGSASIAFQEFAGKMFFQLLKHYKTTDGF